MPSNSIWLNDFHQKYKQLVGKEKTDVLIIGGGISGLTTAYMLASFGVGVIVLEARTICSGTTGHTTAHVTSQHGLIYDKWIKRFGRDTAYLYAESNEKAIRTISNIVNKENINCDFQLLDSYIYTNDEKAIASIEKESEAAYSLGIEASTTVKDIFVQPYKLAVKFKNQAMFNPKKYLDGLAEAIVKMGGKIYENSRVLQIKDLHVSTKTGIVEAKDIVIATHTPIINFPGMYFARMYQSRSYCLALQPSPTLNGMWNSDKQDGCSFRLYEDKLIISGGAHLCGVEGNINHYAQLEDFAKQNIPGAKTVYNWSAQDGITIDGLPYIGQYSKKSDHLYVATGYAKWGMTTGTLAGSLICDLITNKKNPYASIYDPNRSVIPYAVGKAILLNSMVAYHYAGKIVRPQNPRCAHLKCGLLWNKDEQTWDCPCHGSRFTKDGNVIETPSIHDFK